jgi:uncharacterized protein
VFAPLASQRRSSYLLRVKPRCPTCRKALADTDEARPFRPFCSSRCRLADLGKWLNGGFKIESPASEEDLDQGLPTDGNRETEE